MSKRGWLFDKQGQPDPSEAMQADVMAFHLATGSTIGEAPAFRDVELRMNLISEEFEELYDACRPIPVDDGAHRTYADPPLAPAIKELCDLLYVTLGTAVAWGIDIAPFWQRVHRSNMSKLPVTKREDGKVMKSPNYRPPDLDGLL